MGGGSPSVPKPVKPAPPPPPIPPVTAEDPDVKAGAEAVRRRLRGKDGRQGTLLSGDVVGGKTQLGQ